MLYCVNVLILVLYLTLTITVTKFKLSLMYLHPLSPTFPQSVSCRVECVVLCTGYRWCGVPLHLCVLVCLLLPYQKVGQLECSRVRGAQGGRCTHLHLYLYTQKYIQKDVSLCQCLSCVVAVQPNTYCTSVASTIISLSCLLQASGETQEENQICLAEQS